MIEVLFDKYGRHLAIIYKDGLTNYWYGYVKRYDSETKRFVVIILQQYRKIIYCLIIIKNCYNRINNRYTNTNTCIWIW